MTYTYTALEVTRATDRTLYRGVVMQWAFLPYYREERMVANMTCDQGHIFMLTKNEIDFSGSVWPQADCPECDFKEMVILVGWEKDKDEKFVEIESIGA